jgi:hypothetical protein
MEEMKLPLLPVAMLASLLLVCTLPPFATFSPRPSPCSASPAQDSSDRGRATSCRQGHVPSVGCARRRPPRHRVTHLLPQARHLLVYRIDVEGREHTATRWIRSQGSLSLRSADRGLVASRCCARLLSPSRCRQWPRCPPRLSALCLCCCLAPSQRLGTRLSCRGLNLNATVIACLHAMPVVHAEHLCASPRPEAVCHQCLCKSVPQPRHRRQPKPQPSLSLPCLADNKSRVPASRSPFVPLPNSPTLVNVGPITCTHGFLRKLASHRIRHRCEPSMVQDGFPYLALSARHGRQSSAWRCWCRFFYSRPSLLCFSITLTSFTCHMYSLAVRLAVCRERRGARRLPASSRRTRG